MGRRAVESRVYGVNACRALYLRRPGDILRVYLTEARVPGFGDLLAACARLRLPYRIVPDEELVAVTESRHHEGICIVARPRAAVAPEDLLRTPGPACVVGLMGVGNPHNVGAILRTAAHFGVRGVVLIGQGEATGPHDLGFAEGGEAAHPGAGDEAGEAGEPSGEEEVPGAVLRLPAAAARTAQGGAEWLELARAPSEARLLRAARAAGFTVAATSSHGGQALYAAPLPPRLLLLLGAEDEGLSPATLAAADLVLSVPGTGQVESLNVAAAAALILGEHWRARATTSRRSPTPKGHPPVRLGPGAPGGSSAGAPRGPAPPRPGGHDRPGGPPFAGARGSRARLPWTGDPEGGRRPPSHERPGERPRPDDRGAPAGFGPRGAGRGEGAGGRGRPSMGGGAGDRPRRDSRPGPGPRKPGRGR